MSHKFSKNSTYYTIGIYAVIFILLGAIAIKIVWNWGDTASYIERLLSVIQSFIVGLLIAYLINPFVKFIREKILKKIFRNKIVSVQKVLAVIIAYIIVVGAFVVALFYLIPQIVESLTQITNFVNSAQTGYSSIMNKILELNKQYPQWKLDSVITMINGLPDALADVIKNTVPKLLPTIYSTSVSIISSIINFLIAVIVSVYMLLDKEKLINNSKRLLYAVVKPEKADRFLETASECNRIFGNFIIGKMIDSLIIGILCWIIMTIIGLPYALVISVIVGVTNMIPYFGPFIGAVPGILLLIIADFSYALIFAVLILALQQFDGLYLGPKILGESTGLRPIWIIFAITVGGWVAGVAGMFLGVPVVAVIAYLTERYVNRKLAEKNVEFNEDTYSGVIVRKKCDVDEAGDNQTEAVSEVNVQSVEDKATENNLDETTE